MKSGRSRLSQTIADQTLQSGVTGQLAKKLAAYLLEEGRTNELDSILRDVQAGWAAAGYVEVEAASAHELTAEVKAGIVAEVRAIYPNAKQIMITERHDPEIIGGVRLSLPNRQLDLSIEAKLNKFKQLTNAGKV